MRRSSFNRRENLILGAHMSIAGGVHKALERARSVSCETVQIFTRNQLRWSAPALQAAEVQAFHRLSGRFRRIVAHASYLINLASPEEEVYRKSIAALAEELQRCRVLGIPVLILHPGSHRGRGFEQGLERLVRGVREVFEDEQLRRVQLTLETTAGGGSALGGSFEELRDLLRALEAEGISAGVCLDTCHVFAAGYELRNRRGYAATWRRFDEVIGRQYLTALHLNDSLGTLGSRRDRHAHIGRGRIGRPGFRLLTRDPNLAEIPGILETPKGRDMREDVENLRLLRELGGSSRV